MGIRRMIFYFAVFLSLAKASQLFRREFFTLLEFFWILRLWIAKYVSLISVWRHILITSAPDTNRSPRCFIYNFRPILPRTHSLLGPLESSNQRFLGRKMLLVFSVFNGFFSKFASVRADSFWPDQNSNRYWMRGSSFFWTMARGKPF